MGTQIELWLTPDDTRQLARDLASACGRFEIIQAQSTSNRPERLSSLPLTRPGHEPLMVFLVREADVTQLVLRAVTGGQHLWRVDPVTEPVVEFSRPYFSAGEMRAGRMFYEAARYVENELRGKSRDFTDWARKVLATARRVLRYEAEGDAYWGQEATRLQRSGNLKLLPS